jgi:methionyl-tRNA formyltransferase
MNHQPLRIVFAGTPDFAIPSLKALIDCDQCHVVAVYSQPDRQAGRGRKLTETPVKQFALDHHIPVETPINFKEESNRAILAAYKPDLMIVAAYGLILPQSVLDIPIYGCINVHASLLPRWRGAAPIQAAILAGDAQAGVGIMRMEKGLDTGGVYCEKSMAIPNDMNAAQLTEQLGLLGGQALVESIKHALYKTVPKPQPEVGITYAHKIQNADAQIDWDMPAEKIQRHIRAYWPWPGAFTFHRAKRIKIASSIVKSIESEHKPGMIIAVNEEGLIVTCQDRCLAITACQPEGKSLGPIKQWLSYFKVGDMFMKQ